MPRREVDAGISHLQIVPPPRQEDRAHRVVVDTSPSGIDQQRGLGADVLLVVEQDRRVTHPAQGGVPTGTAFIQQATELDVGLEGVAAGYLEPAIDEDLALGSVVEHVDTGLPEAGHPGMIGQPRPTGEPCGVVGVDQRRGHEPEIPPFAGGAEELAGDGGDDEHSDQTSHHGARTQRHRSPRLPHGELGRELGGPLSEVGGEDEPSRQREEAHVTDRLEAEVAERHGQEHAGQSATGAMGQTGRRDAQGHGHPPQGRRAGTGQTEPGGRAGLRPEQVRPQPDHPRRRRHAADARQPRR